MTWLWETIWRICPVFLCHASQTIRHHAWRKLHPLYSRILQMPRFSGQNSVSWKRGNPFLEKSSHVPESCSGLADLRNDPQTLHKSLTLNNMLKNMIPPRVPPHPPKKIHSIHVWYIYPHLPYNWPNVGKYTLDVWIFLKPRKNGPAPCRKHQGTSGTFVSMNLQLGSQSISALFGCWNWLWLQ